MEFNGYVWVWWALTEMEQDVVQAVVLPPILVVVAAAWKALAKRGETNREDWMVGFDVLLAATSLVLLSLGASVGQLLHEIDNLSADGPAGAEALRSLIWICIFKFGLLVIIEASQLIMAVRIKNNYGPNTDKDGRPMPNDTAMRWNLVGGGTLLPLNYVAIVHMENLYELVKGRLL